jgi:hypothetical protein
MIFSENRCTLFRIMLWHDDFWSSASECPNHCRPAADQAPKFLLSEDGGRAKLEQQIVGG